MKPTEGKLGQGKDARSDANGGASALGRYPTRYRSRTETRRGHDGTGTANVRKSEPLYPSYQ
jgi:hypothetical protein